MSQYNVDSLQDITASQTAIANGSPMKSGPVVAWFQDFNNRISNLNDCYQAIASCQAAGASPAANRQGEIWHDTVNERWFGDPDGSGHDDEFATRLQTQNISLATGGTATHKLMGVIHRNTTQVSTTSASVALMSYTLPADTLNTSNLIRVTAWGTSSGGGGPTVILAIHDGTGPAATSDIEGTSTDWIFINSIIPTTTTSERSFGYGKINRDDGTLPKVSVGNLFSFDTETDTTIQIYITANSGGKTVTQEGMIVELLG